MGSPLPPTLERLRSKKTLLARLAFPGDRALRMLEPPPRLTPRPGEFWLLPAVLRTLGGASDPRPPSSNAFTCLHALWLDDVETH